MSKYADGLPLHRQSVIYARQGVDLDRSTMADWMGSAAALLRPLVEAIRQHVCAGPVLHADDTTVPVLAPGLGRTRTGRLWAAVRDERTWAGTAPPAAFYCYSPDRKGEHAEALLGQCRGFLHADGYGGFQSLYMPDPKTGLPRLTEVGCWSHARRKVYEVYEATASPLAKEALERIAELFAIEERINGRAPPERLAVRQQDAVPLLAELETFLHKALNQISGKSTLAKAIRYSLSRWTALTRYTTDGRLEMTNNAVERAIRPLALTRKNYLFCRLRFRRYPSRRNVHPHRIRQDESPRPGSLSARRACPYCRSSDQSHRRAFTLELEAERLKSLARQTSLCAAPHRRIPSSPPMYS